MSPQPTGGILCTYKRVKHRVEVQALGVAITNMEGKEVATNLGREYRK